MNNYKDKTKKPILNIALTAVVSAVIIAVAFYITLPPVNLHSGAFWAFVLFAVAVVTVADLIFNGTSLGGYSSSHSIRGAYLRLPIRFRVLITVAAVVALLLIILGIFSSEFLRSDAYSSMIELDEVEFSEAIAESEHVSDIALMDSASARIIGNRTLGSLADLVSQFVIAEDYTQIALNSTPAKVAPLEYASFFKWLGNRRDGIPGYVKVDPVEFDAEFVRLDEGKYIKYSPSAYFSKNLSRALRFSYPFDIFGTVNFETDESGKPYWVCPTLKPRAGFFGGYDAAGVIILDASTGESTKYELGEIPDWVDIVYSGDLICQKYDWYGELSGGYINYMFAQTGCTATTDDFGYKIIGNDVYIYTGITSLSSDAANIGFILVNSRTGEYRYFSVPGAEEYSAMSAAEGSLQQYGYVASFPSLINVRGEPTYIMVLKDASGIVKMYAMVNVRNYNIAVTAENQEELVEKYIVAAQLDGKDDTPTDDEELLEVTLTVLEKYLVTLDGDTVVYLKCENGEICSLPFSAELLRVESGDEVTVKYKSEADGIYDGVSLLTHSEN